MSLPLNFNRLFTKVPFNELPLLEGVKLLDEKITIQLTHSVGEYWKDE